MTETFSCPACGAPNNPEADHTQMSCSYCGANLTIPAHLRTSAPPKVEIMHPKAAPAPHQEIDASELLRQAQPVVTKAWNTYAWWTWIRRALPACLVVVLIGLCACAALTMLPFVLNR